MNPTITALADTEAAGPWLRLDIWLFRRLGAGHGSSTGLRLAGGVARWSVLPMLALALQAALSHPQGAWLLAPCLLWVGLVQLAGKRLARRWRAQRPFVLGLCANHLGHSARAGFPSSHALAMGALLGSLAPFTADAGLLVAMAAVALATAWARVHTGAHFPLDVASGLALGLASGLMGGLALALLLPH